MGILIALRAAFFAAFAVVFGLGLAAPAHAKKLALVIGNDKYLHLESLQRANEDAGAYANYLRSRGYDVVQLRDASYFDTTDALSALYDKIQQGDTVVVVYSGHGWSDGSVNYMIPTDTPALSSASRIRQRSIPMKNGVNGILDEIRAKGAKLRVFIFDACRNDPFPNVNNERSGQSLRGGLVSINPSEGTFVVFSAGEKQTALDRLGNGDRAPFSVFTRYFLQELQNDRPLQAAVKSVQAKVRAAAKTVGHDQRPAYYDEVVGDACLSDKCKTPPKETPTEADICTSLYREANLLEDKCFALLHYARQCLTHEYVDTVNDMLKRECGVSDQQPQAKLDLQPQPQPQPRQPAKIEFKAYANSDFYGGDMLPEGLRPMTYDQCKKFCTSNTGCVGFSWVQNQNWCWPKSSITSMTAKQGIYAAQKLQSGASANAGASQPVQTGGAAAFQRTANVDFVGRDLTQMGIRPTSLEQCEAICQRDASCTAYTYVRSKQWCWPKFAVGGVDNNSDAISGRKATR